MMIPMRGSGQLGFVALLACILSSFSLCVSHPRSLIHQACATNGEEDNFKPEIQRSALCQNVGMFPGNEGLYGGWPGRFGIVNDTTTQGNGSWTGNNAHLEQVWESERTEVGNQQASPPSEDSGGRRRSGLEAVDGEWIVRFREYRKAGEHLEAMRKALGADGDGMWEWVVRHNPAAAFPTDFGLLRMGGGAQGVDLRTRMAALPFVKDVSPQMRFTRALMSENGRGRRGRGDGTGVRVEKPPGRMQTRMSFEEGGGIFGNVTYDHSRELLNSRSQITSMFESDKLWGKGFTGQKVRMAVFDTGIREDHPHFRNIEERTNWTNEDTLNDNLGHGTFVAGVISSKDPECLGFAPDAEIYAFRVFTNAQVSYTSWFLDAFNYAIATRMNVLNLSIGGPDYMDRPFVEKVWEMTANKIIMVSAIGNDGPLYGTLNNPADQSDVIGVGGIDYGGNIASFSSRGMSTWELPYGYGRVKPDIVAYGREVIGSAKTSGCKSLSGTSVASPVVAGAVCLLASVVPEEGRWDILNPASMKQALVEGATRLEGSNMYEQGVGRLNLLESYKVLASYKPRASILPDSLDLTLCPFSWPFCRQPLYAGAMPVIFNATILNGMGVVGWLEGPPVWTTSTPGGDILDVQFTYSDSIWPWTGFLGLHFYVKAEGANFKGPLEGEVRFTVVSPPGKGETEKRRCEVRFPVKAEVIPTPPREQRVLWDQFHNVRYPPGYIPRDSLDVRSDILDWHGDHLHTNYHGLYDALRDAGYFIEILGSPLTCFDASQYGTLLLVDLEDEYHPEEIVKLHEDVTQQGLGLIVFADWYHVDTMVKMKFFDDNTRSWWTPATGGSNVPALNDLLAPFGIAFGDTILNGGFSIAGDRATYASGTDLRHFPSGGFVHRFLFQDVTGGDSGITSSRDARRVQAESPILGLVDADRGRVVAYGDSNCLDSSHMVSDCYWLIRKLLDFTSKNIRDPPLFPLRNELVTPLGTGLDVPLPRRRDDVNFTEFSLVLGRPLVCGLNTPRRFQGSPGLVPEARLPLTPPTESEGIQATPEPISVSRQRIALREGPLETSIVEQKEEVTLSILPPPVEEQNSQGQQAATVPVVIDKPQEVVQGEGRGQEAEVLLKDGEKGETSEGSGAKETTSVGVDLRKGETNVDGDRALGGSDGVKEDLRAAREVVGESGEEGKGRGEKKVRRGTGKKGKQPEVVRSASVVRGEDERREQVGEELGGDRSGGEGRMGEGGEAVGGVKGDLSKWHEKKQSSELDSTLMAFHRCTPVLLCLIGFVLILSLWQNRQKKKRRARQGGSASNRRGMPV